MDPTIQAEILDLLRSLQESLGLAIILVTHDLGVVADICDAAQVMVRRPGRRAIPGRGTARSSTASLQPRPTGSMPESAIPGELLPTLPGTVPLPKDWPDWCRFAARCPLAVDACRQGPIPLLAVAKDRASRCIRHTELEIGIPS